MKADAQRIAIAEACGWVWAKWGEAPGETNRFLLHPGNPPSRDMLPCPRPSHGTPVNWGNLPRFTDDLNAMHEAEKVLTPDQLTDYCAILGDFVGRDSEWADFEAMVRATAAQRAEAFLRTIGKWTE